MPRFLHRLFPVLLLLSTAAVPAARPTPTVEADYRALVEAERSFAAYGQAHSVKDAFGKYLATAFLFREGEFVLGGPYYAQQPERPGRLTWEPAYARVATSGNWGFTTGPATFQTGSESDPTVYYSDFVTIWQKGPAGTWQVTYDGGIGHEAPPTPAPDLTYPEKYPAKQTSVADTSTLRSNLQRVEASFAARALLNLSQAYAGVLPEQAADFRLLREGALPYTGAAARAMANSSSQAVSFQPFRAAVAPSGDLGYTMGYAEYNDKPGHYLRIWQRKGAQWQLALELLTTDLK